MFSFMHIALTITFGQMFHFYMIFWKIKIFQKIMYNIALSMLA